jgi:hypothetical protein
MDTSPVDMMKVEGSGGFRWLNAFEKMWSEPPIQIERKKAHA